MLDALLSRLQSSALSGNRVAEVTRGNHGALRCNPEKSGAVTKPAGMGSTVTLVTPCDPAGVTLKPAPIGTCTLVTPVTPQITKAESEPPKVGAATDSRWLLHFADRNPLTVAFSPAATHAEVLDAYPCAVAAEPIEPGRRQPDTLLAGDQEAAVMAWLAQIGETDRAIIDDVLAQCRQDEEGRAYYLGRAGADPQIDDDRRFCTECRNLRGGVSIVARPGGVVSAIRGYRPVLVNVPVRCAGYSRIEISGG